MTKQFFLSQPAFQPDIAEPADRWLGNRKDELGEPYFYGKWQVIGKMNIPAKNIDLSDPDVLNKLRRASTGGAM